MRQSGNHSRPFQLPRISNNDRELNQAETVQSVPNDTIRLRMVANMSSSILRQIRMKRVRLEIDNNVTVQGVEGTDQEKSVV